YFVAYDSLSGTEPDQGRRAATSSETPGSERTGRERSAVITARRPWLTMAGSWSRSLPLLLRRRMATTGRSSTFQERTGPIAKPLRTSRVVNVGRVYRRTCPTASSCADHSLGSHGTATT